MMEDNDFGFTAIDYDPVAEMRDTFNTKQKMQQLEELILPLLKNLQKNPDKPTIHWPNRAEVIQQQIDKILSITRS